MTISVLYTVHNEITRLPAAIAEMQPFVDEIVVVDQASTDGTAEKAEELGAKVVRDICRGFSEASRDTLVGAASGDWLLEMYPDELLATPFRDRLRQLCDQSEVDGYHLLRQTIISLHTGTHTFPDAHHFRLWRRGTAHLPLVIHSNPAPTTPRNVLLPELAILHIKTAAEQNLDSHRYIDMGQVTPGFQDLV